ncbi:MAG TPA: glycosyltransferase family 9 protein [Ktedonobacteraceae bacterium]|jgi:ADP-heptose:LPS heptosyltransferase|nr:glycosyltransferase family 9 protein [Ktedonobacteraceae bacterium]
MLEKQSFQALSPQVEDRANVLEGSRYLITLDKGIGDAVAIGLSAVDQIIQNDPAAYGNVDILCNTIQAEIFAHDPRIKNIFATDITFFPSLEPSSWLKTVFLEDEKASMVHFLREQHYKGVFPSIVAPGLYLGLHSHIMLPNILRLAQNLLLRHHPADVSLRTLARQMVNRAFGKQIPDTVLADEEVLLYISAQHVRKAMQTVGLLKEQARIDGAGARLLLVAPDSASAVTRPPTDLLAAALSEALAQCPYLIVSILPGYTDKAASENLYSALSPRFEKRVFLQPATPRAGLLETAAFLDQADILVSGDTGIMHLAAATKMLKPGSELVFRPRNTVRIITLFGGTNPDYYGYGKRTTIIGRGRKEQNAFRPGFAKEGYDTHGRNLFDHIAPREVAEAIINHMGR